MMSKKQNAVFTYGIMNTVMCVCMAATALIVNVGPANIVPPMYLVTLVQALVICNLCTLIFRIPGISFRAAMALSGRKPGSMAFTIWNGLFNATLNTVFMNTIMTLINVGITPAYFPAWLHGAGGGGGGRILCGRAHRYADRDRREKARYRRRVKRTKHDIPDHAVCCLLDRARHGRNALERMKHLYG